MQRGERKVRMQQRRRKTYHDPEGKTTVSLLTLNTHLPQIHKFMKFRWHSVTYAPGSLGR